MGQDLVITHIFMRANIYFLLFDREAVQDSSRRSRSAPTDRVQINLNRPRGVSQRRSATRFGVENTENDTLSVGALRDLRLLSVILSGSKKFG